MFQLRGAVLMTAVLPTVPVPENRISPTSKLDLLLMSVSASSLTLSVLSSKTIFLFMSQNDRDIYEQYLKIHNLMMSYILRCAIFKVFWSIQR